VPPKNCLNSIDKLMYDVVFYRDRINCNTKNLLTIRTSVGDAVPLGASKSGYRSILNDDIRYTGLTVWTKSHEVLTFLVRDWEQLASTRIGIVMGTHGQVIDPWIPAVNTT